MKCEDVALAYYPLNMELYLNQTLDGLGVPYDSQRAMYDPTTIAQYGLAHWNLYCNAPSEEEAKCVLLQVGWLIDNEISIGVGGWKAHSFSKNGNTPTHTYVSASTQGYALSLLTRAYQLTYEHRFLHIARRVIRTLEVDILDGGVAFPIGADGVFFEDKAMYPATHALGGCMVALIGLYDYLTFVDDRSIELLAQQALRTLDTLLHEFDCSFWTYEDLLHKKLASPLQHSFYIHLLEALGKYYNSEQYLSWATRWKNYTRSSTSILRYQIMSHIQVYRHSIADLIRKKVFKQTQDAHLRRVCVPITSFPFTGGMRTVLQGMAQVTTDTWQIEYLTQRVGANTDGLCIHTFGTTKMSPWQFPFVWLYVVTGFIKLASLMLRSHYDIVLPQDGVFTAAFAAFGAKLAGSRVVCVDHGNLTLLNSSAYRVERMQALSEKNFVLRILLRFLIKGYWPSLTLLARISARFIDSYLIPGVSEDGTEQVCSYLGIPSYKVTRFGSMIDTKIFLPLDPQKKELLRKKYCVENNARVIVMTCRLSPEKGIHIAMEAISKLLAALSPYQRSLVHVIIAGEGPLQAYIEDTIQRFELGKNVFLWGETTTSDVISLLGMSDIFLYTSVRGACMSMAVLEAMASGCAVIASTRPLSNASLLANNRGIAIPAEDVDATATALFQLVNEPECCQRMGSAARTYVEKYHSPAIFKRTLLRATYWSEA